MSQNKYFVSTEKNINGQIVAYRVCYQDARVPGFNFEVDNSYFSSSKIWDAASRKAANDLCDELNREHALKGCEN